MFCAHSMALQCSSAHYKMVFRSFSTCGHILIKTLDIEEYSDSNSENASFRTDISNNKLYFKSMLL